MKYDELIKGIYEFRNTNILIIVEGKKDKAALLSLGFSNIHTLKKALYLEAEEIAEKNKVVMILTDFDKEGKKIYNTLKKYLSLFGVFIDDRFTNFLYKNTKINQIEGILSYLEKKQKEEKN